MYLCVYVCVCVGVSLCVLTVVIHICAVCKEQSSKVEEEVFCVAAISLWTLSDSSQLKNERYFQGLIQNSSSFSSQISFIVTGFIPFLTIFLISLSLSVCVCVFVCGVCVCACVFMILCVRGERDGKDTCVVTITYWSGVLIGSSMSIYQLVKHLQHQWSTRQITEGTCTCPWEHVVYAVLVNTYIS